MSFNTQAHVVVDQHSTFRYPITYCCRKSNIHPNYLHEIDKMCVCSYIGGINLEYPCVLLWAFWHTFHTRRTYTVCPFIQTFDAQCALCSPWGYSTGIPGGPIKMEQSIFQNFALINIYLFTPCWIEHLFLIIITPRSSNLVENFLFYEKFLMDCHFWDLPLVCH